MAAADEELLLWTLGRHRELQNILLLLQKKVALSPSQEPYCLFALNGGRRHFKGFSNGRQALFCGAARFAMMLERIVKRSQPNRTP